MTCRRQLDYYGILGIERNATIMEVKKAYRDLTVQYNPERHKDPHLYTLFKLIGEAFDVLSDPYTRALYDQHGEVGMKKDIRTDDQLIPAYAYHGDPLRTYKEFFWTANPYADLTDGGPHIDFDSTPIEKIKQEPIIKYLGLTLEEVYYGGTKKMKIDRRVFSGDEPGATEIKERILTIPIKRGLPAGTQFTFHEICDQGTTIIPGDVTFVTEDKPHDNYKREGNNLVMKCEVSLSEALTGDLVMEIQTLDNRCFHINITDVITPEYVYIVKGEGMPLVEDPNKSGDLLIKFKIHFPKQLPKHSKELISKALTGKGLNPPGSPEHIHKLVNADTLRRLSCGALVPISFR